MGLNASFIGILISCASMLSEPPPDCTTLTDICDAVEACILAIWQPIIVRVSPEPAVKAAA